jgi:hypothetical protein
MTDLLDWEPTAASALATHDGSAPTDETTVTATHATDSPSSGAFDTPHDPTRAIVGDGTDDTADTAEPALHHVSEKDVDDALAQMVSTIPGGQMRVGQQQMAHAVARALNDNTHAFVEAPTGTGKSYAYLIPSALAAGSRPILVATATKTLQQQLIDSDLPRLVEQFPDLTYSILKGRSNFMCKDKVADAEADQLTFGFRIA